MVHPTMAPVTVIHSIVAHVESEGWEKETVIQGVGGIFQVRAIGWLGIRH